MGSIPGRLKPKTIILQGCDFSADSRISVALGSNLAISVNRVNSWRKFMGGGLDPANLENDIV